MLYAGRLTKEKGSDLLAESFLRAHERDPRLHLLLAGGGPEEDELRARLGDRATFLGWLDRSELATAYASADIFLFCSQTDTYGQVIAEAQASGLPVVAVDEGGPASLIHDRQTGWLCEPDAERHRGRGRAARRLVLPARADVARRDRVGPGPHLGGRDGAARPGLRPRPRRRRARQPQALGASAAHGRARAAGPRGLKDLARGSHPLDRIGSVEG